MLAAVGFFVLSLALAWLGLSGAERTGMAGFDRTTASLLNLVLLFVPLVTLTLGGLGLAGEIEDGSLGMLLSQPLSRGEVYAGKYLGSLVAVAAAVAVGFGTTGIIVGLATGGGDVAKFIALVGSTMLLAASTLAIGTALSAALTSRARVMGAAFSAWLLLVYLSDLGTIGLVIARELTPGKVFALALLNPVEQARVLGTITLSERLDILGPAGLAALDLFGRSGVVLVAAAALCASACAALGLGYSLFRKAVVP
ncbi:ABC transporter permease [Myxococcota bacterium]|nr:ABC transporter permease [Myxococcota bacterium]